MQSPMEKEELERVLGALGLDEQMYMLSKIPTDMILLELRTRYETMEDIINRVKGAIV